MRSSATHQVLGQLSNSSPKTLLQLEGRCLRIQLHPSMGPLLLWILSLLWTSAVEFLLYVDGWRTDPPRDACLWDAWYPIVIRTTVMDRNVKI